MSFWLMPKNQSSFIINMVQLLNIYNILYYELGLI